MKQMNAAYANEKGMQMNEQEGHTNEKGNANECSIC